MGKKSLMFDLGFSSNRLGKNCFSCGLYKECNSPNISCFGEGKKKILLVGECPGREEDKIGIPFVGPSGRLLEELLGDVGLSLDGDCYRTNACRCFCSKTPSDDNIEFCRDFLLKDIEELSSSCIITLGSTALKSILGCGLWKEHISSLEPWVGQIIPIYRFNSWLVPLWHPSYILREGDSEKGLVLKKAFCFYLNLAKKYCKEPLPERIDISKCTKILGNDIELISRELGGIGKGDYVSVDIETDRVKPESSDSWIVCISFAWDGRAVSFLWTKEVFDLVKKILEDSSIFKVGWNIKFEDRWFRSRGIRVKGWAWDGMLATHVLDSRNGVTSLKFQAFVQFGVETYDDEIKSFLRADSGNESNRIREVDRKKLLLYNCIDSLLTWFLWKKQRENISG